MFIVYIIILLGYARSPFRDLESYLRMVVALDEDDIELILKIYIEKYITYEFSPDIDTNKDFSGAVYSMGDHEGTLENEYDDITMKTKLNLTRFGSTIGTFRLDKKSFFHTLLEHTPCWYYKPFNAIHAQSLGVYTNDKILYLSTIHKIQLN